MKFPNYIVFLYGNYKKIHKSRIQGWFVILDMEKMLYFFGVAEEKYNFPSRTPAKLLQNSGSHSCKTPAGCLGATKN